MGKFCFVIIFVLMSLTVFSQDKDYAVIHFFRDKDFIVDKKLTKLYSDNVFRMALIGNSYDTIQVNPGIHEFRINKKAVYEENTEKGRDYYFMIYVDRGIVFSKFLLIEVTENYAKNRIKIDSLKRKRYSLKNQKQ